MRKRFFLCVCLVLLSGIMFKPITFAEKVKVKTQKYQMAVYFESWERIFIALTVPNLEASSALAQEEFEKALEEFDGDRSKVVITFSKAVAVDEYHLADEYKLEKLFKKNGFGEIIFKQACGDCVE